MMTIEDAKLLVNALLAAYPRDSVIVPSEVVEISPGTRYNTTTVYRKEVAREALFELLDRGLVTRFTGVAPEAP